MLIFLVVSSMLTCSMDAQIHTDLLMPTFSTNPTVPKPTKSRDKRSLLSLGSSGFTREIMKDFMKYTSPDREHSYKSNMLPEIPDTFYNYNTSYDNGSSLYEYSQEYPHSYDTMDYQQKELQKEIDIMRELETQLNQTLSHFKKNYNNKRRRKRKRKKNRRNQNGKRIFGPDACLFKILKYCAKGSKILPKRIGRKLTDVSRCSQRQNFLNCVEQKRRRRKCRAKARARGNLKKLRSWIVNVFQTSYSCLLNEIILS